MANLGNTNIFGDARINGPVIIHRTVQINSSDNDAIDFTSTTASNDRGISFNGKIGLSSSGGNWLRLNNNSDFSNGVYTPGTMRADGRFECDNSASINNFKYAQARVVSDGNLGSSYTLNWGSRTYTEGTLNSDVTISHSNETEGTKVSLVLYYDGSAQRTITWNDVDKWEGGSAPPAPSSGEVLIVTMVKIGGTVYASGGIFS